jgi:hypothetical protein
MLKCKLECKFNPKPSTEHNHFPAPLDHKKTPGVVGFTYQAGNLAIYNRSFLFHD